MRNACLRCTFIKGSKGETANFVKFFVNVCNIHILHLSPYILITTSPANTNHDDPCHWQVCQFLWDRASHPNSCVLSFRFCFMTKRFLHLPLSATRLPALCRWPQGWCQPGRWLQSYDQIGPPGYVGNLIWIRQPHMHHPGKRHGLRNSCHILVGNMPPTLGCYTKIFQYKKLEFSKWIASPVLSTNKKAKPPHWAIWPLLWLPCSGCHPPLDGIVEISANYMVGGRRLRSGLRQARGEKCFQQLNDLQKRAFTCLINVRGLQGCQVPWSSRRTDGISLTNMVIRHIYCLISISLLDLHSYHLFRNSILEELYAVVA